MDEKEISFGIRVEGHIGAVLDPIAVSHGATLMVLYRLIGFL